MKPEPSYWSAAGPGGRHRFPEHVQRRRGVPLPSARRNVSGFTLLELLVVLAIIAVIATISMPTIESITSPRHVLRSEGRRVMKLMTEARTAAIARKAEIELRIDPARHEIRMIETQAGRVHSQKEEPFGFGSDEITNRYEKTVVLKEEIELDIFTTDQIRHSVNNGTDPFREPGDFPVVETGEPVEQRAIVFTHLGGSDGGGVSLSKEGVRLDIAADLLTGRPKIVKRDKEE